MDVNTLSEFMLWLSIWTFKTSGDLMADLHATP